MRLPLALLVTRSKVNDSRAACPYLHQPTRKGMCLRLQRRHGLMEPLELHKTMPSANAAAVNLRSSTVYQLNRQRQDTANRRPSPVPSLTRGILILMAAALTLVAAATSTAAATAARALRVAVEASEVIRTLARTLLHQWLEWEAGPWACARVHTLERLELRPLR